MQEQCILQRSLENIWADEVQSQHCGQHGLQALSSELCKLRADLVTVAAQHITQDGTAARVTLQSKAAPRRCRQVRCVFMDTFFVFSHLFLPSTAFDRLPQ